MHRLARVPSQSVLAFPVHVDIPLTKYILCSPIRPSESGPSSFYARQATACTTVPMMLTRYRQLAPLQHFFSLKIMAH
jgi:hypothetical protein